MAIDVARVVQAAVQAAMEQPAQDGKPKKRRLPGARAALIGAGVVTAGRLLAGPKGRELLGSVQQRIAESDWYSEDEDQDDDIEAEGDEDFDEEDYEDEPTDEGDEDPDEEEPADEDEPAEEEEPADDEDAPRPRRKQSSKQRSRSRS